MKKSRNLLFHQVYGKGYRAMRGRTHVQVWLEVYNSVWCEVEEVVDQYLILDNVTLK